MKYFYEFTEIKSLTITELINEFENNGKKISEFKIQDFIFFDGNPISTGKGVYVFKNKGKIFYIGKNSSRCFAERIPAHFDIRGEGWFNRLLRLISKEIYHEDNSIDLNIQHAAHYAIDNIELILINFRVSDIVQNNINILEDILRMSTEAVNKKKNRIDNFDQTIEDIIKLKLN